MGEKQNQFFQLSFIRLWKVDFRLSVTSTVVFFWAQLDDVWG